MWDKKSGNENFLRDFVENYGFSTRATKQCFIHLLLVGLSKLSPGKADPKPGFWKACIASQLS